MTSLALLALAAAVAFGAGRLSGAPVAPLLLVAGVALHRAGGAWLDPGVVEACVALGLAFLLFSAGLELSLPRVLPRLRAVVGVTACQLLVVGSAAAALALGLGAEPTAAAYVGLAIAGSSTLVVVRVLAGRGQLFEPFGRLVLGVLLLQDLLLIVLLTPAEQLGDGPLAAAQALGAAVALLGLVVAVMRYVAPWFVARFEDDPDLLLLGAVAWLFLAVEIARRLGVAEVAGAFLAGIALSGFPVRESLRHRLQPFADFFTALFFTALGAFLPTPRWLDVGLAALVVVGLAAVTVPVVALTARRYGLSARAAIESGLLLSQTSELSIVVALQGVAAGHLGLELLSFLTLVTALSMAVTPVLAADRVAIALMRLLPSRRGRAERPRETDGHVVVLGYGRATRPVVEALRRDGVEVVVVDDDPGVVRQVAEGGVPALRGDAADPRLLSRVGADRASAVVVGVRRTSTALEVLRHLPGRPVLIHALDPGDAARIQAAGGTPIVYVEPAVDELLGWMRRRAAPGEG